MASGVLNREDDIFLYLWLKGIFPLKITEQWPVCPWRCSYITLYQVGSWDKGILGHKKERSWVNEHLWVGYGKAKVCYPHELKYTSHVYQSHVTKTVSVPLGCVSGAYV